MPTAAHMPTMPTCPRAHKSTPPDHESTPPDHESTPPDHMPTSPPLQTTCPQVHPIHPSGPRDHMCHRQCTPVPNTSLPPGHSKTWSHDPAHTHNTALTRHSVPTASSSQPASHVTHIMPHYRHCKNLLAAGYLLLATCHAHTASGIAHCTQTKLQTVHSYGSLPGALWCMPGQPWAAERERMTVLVPHGLPLRGAHQLQAS
jgi:hypothetical protein